MSIRVIEHSTRVRRLIQHQSPTAPLDFASAMSDNNQMFHLTLRIHGFTSYRLQHLTLVTQVFDHIQTHHLTFKTDVFTRSQVTSPDFAG